MLKKEIYLILHNIRSEFNVGSIFRTADAVGVKKIFLTGYSPSPVDRFGREAKGISKVALGAEKNINWEKKSDIIHLISKLKANGFYVISVEQSKKAFDYKKIKIPNKSVFIFGNEVNGLSAKILEQSNAITEIQMKGKKESLNVSVSAGVVLFRVLNI